MKRGALTMDQRAIFAAVKQSRHAQILQMQTERDLKASDFDAKDEAGNTPLYYAVCNKSFETVRSLLQIGVNVNAKNSNGNTALHRAVM